MNWNIETYEITDRLVDLTIIPEEEHKYVKYKSFADYQQFEAPVRDHLDDQYPGWKFVTIVYFIKSTGYQSPSSLTFTLEDLKSEGHSELWNGVIVLCDNNQATVHHSRRTKGKVTNQIGE